MDNKALTLLGFASKAGKLQFGMAKTEESIKKNQARLIVCACDVSAKSQKEIAYLTRDKDTNLYVLQNTTQAQLSAAVGRSCGIIAVTDSGFAGAISKILGGNANDQ